MNWLSLLSGLATSGQQTYGSGANASPNFGFGSGGGGGMDAMSAMGGGGGGGMMGAMMGGGGGGMGGGGGQPQWGMEAMTQGPELLNQVQNQAMGAPQSTTQGPQMAAGMNQGQIDQMVAQTPQANFGQFIDDGNGVLPPPDAIQPSAPYPTPLPGGVPLPPGAAPVQQYPVGAGQQQPPQAQGWAGGGAAAPQSGGAQFSDFFNMTGSAPSSPMSGEGFNPNMFLRMSEGYNRGGLLGSLGMLLTDFK